MMTAEKRNPAKAHAAIVRNYQWCRDLMTTGQARSPEGAEKTARGGMVAATAMKNAVIYEIPLSLFKSLYRASDIYTCVSIAGLEWHDPDDDPVPRDHLIKQMPHYWESVSTAGRKVPFPSKFSFPYMWLALDRPLQLRDNQREFFFCDEWPMANLVGFLVSDQGFLWTVIIVANNDNLILDDLGRVSGANVNLHCLTEYDCDAGWYGPMTLTPWVAPALIEWINDHKVVTVEKVGGLHYRRLFRQSAKKRKYKMRVPPPYYAVTMRDEVVEAAARERFASKKRREYQHQWQVTGHDRIRIKRGPLPLDDKTRAELLKPRAKGARYQIYEYGHPADELAQQLWRRGVKPKGDREWLAVLVSRVDDYVKGPVDAPFIPSTRRSGRSTEPSP